MKVFRVALVIYDRTLLRKAFLIAKNIVEREKKRKKILLLLLCITSHTTVPHTHTSKILTKCRLYKSETFFFDSLEFRVGSFEKLSV